MERSNEEWLREIDRHIELDTIELRKQFIAEVEMAAESADFIEWQAQCRIFSVTYEGRNLFPRFQFSDDGHPLPIVHELLCILSRDKERTPWDDALWFAGDSGWLDGATPIDSLITDPDGVRLAAEQEVLRDC